MSESPEEAREGYPEEAPPGADPGGSHDNEPRDGAKAPRKHDDQADAGDDGTATGNPDAAG